jgi:myo-inositol-1-phosphate synthase
MSEARDIRSPRGKLGVLTVGLGAVATTFIAGVELIKKGLAEPVGSLTQLGTIRLGKRTEDRVPKIKDFVPLDDLDDLIFGGWDAFPDDAYEAATVAGVLDKEHLNAARDELRAIEPFPAVFDRATSRGSTPPTPGTTAPRGRPPSRSGRTSAPSKKSTVWTGS